MSNIQHIWFDFSQTLTLMNEEGHKRLRYETYARVTGKELTENLRKEYEEQYTKYKSHSGIFKILTGSSEFWSEQVARVEFATLHQLAEPCIPEVLNQLRVLLPISLFSNVLAREFLPKLGIDPNIFTHILGPKEVKNPKPALDGFHMMIERSNLPAENILFVGDSLEKELLPAKSLGIQTGLMWTESPEADYCFKSFKDIVAVVHSSRDGRL